VKAFLLLTENLS